MRAVALSFLSLVTVAATSGCPVKTVCNTGFVLNASGACVPTDGGGVDAGGGEGGPSEGGPPDLGPVDAGPCGHACTGAAPVCDAPSGTCVECASPSDCAAAAGHVCDTSTHHCVACVADTDCTTPAAPTCDPGSHACVSCTTSADCTHLAGTTVCDMTGVAGLCVECNATADTACGANVCDSAMHTCTTFPRHGTGLCGSCVADAQCMTGQLCVPMTFGTSATPVGDYCLQRQDVTGSCAAPYFGVVTTASVDGVSTTTCGLRVTTCPALLDYSARPCGDLPDGGIPDGGVSADGGVPDDDRCGVAGLADGVCAEVPADHSLLCTIPCVGPQDCQTGTTCPAASPRVCTL